MKKVFQALVAGLFLVSAVHGVSHTEGAMTDVTPLQLPGQLVSRLDDPALSSLTLSLPEGSAAVVIAPDTGEGLSQGYIEAVDAKGRALVREEHLAGLAVEVQSASDTLRGLGLPENDPLVLMVPPRTTRVEIQGQVYDEAGDPQGDGSIRCYDAQGRLLHEEAALSLDLFMF